MKVFDTPAKTGITIAMAGLVLPLLVAALADGIGSLFGCEVNAGGVGICMVAGIDVMPALAAMTVFGWFMLLAPFWLILLVISSHRRSLELRDQAERGSR